MTMAVALPKKGPTSSADGGALLLGRALMRVMSPGGTRGLSILIYHRVLPQQDPLFPGEVTRVDFDRQVGLVKSCFNVIPLLDAVRQVQAGTLPPRAACITFDDGYADNAEIALPVLQAHGVSATFFVATGFLNGGRMWNDTVIETVRHARGARLDASTLGLGSHAIGSTAQRQAAIGALIGALKYLPMEERLAQVGRLVEVAGVTLPGDLMMTSEQVRQLHRAGMGIGAHTVNHPILARLPLDQARLEIAQGKAELEAIIGERVPLFAYPNGKPHGDYAAEHVALVKELGFEGAVSTAWGAHRSMVDTFQLPRFSPWDKGNLRYLLRLAGNLTRPAQRV
jgi:peptidoglycan/xylan/chitin deacetylase (PgdA/CDA1 family)